RSRSSRRKASADSAILPGRHSAPTRGAAAAAGAAGTAAGAAAVGAGRGGAAGRARGGGGGGQGRAGGKADRAPRPTPRPGLTNSLFVGGYNLSFWVADVKTGDAQEFWHNAKDEKLFNGINAIAWQGDHVVFQMEPEEWTRFYSVQVPAISASLTHNTGPNARPAVVGVGEPPPVTPPVSLTPQDGQIETFSYSPDGKYLYYGTNATDTERRHLWRVALAGGAPWQTPKGPGMEQHPFLLPSGRVAALTAAFKRPQSVAIFPP